MRPLRQCQPNQTHQPMPGLVPFRKLAACAHRAHNDLPWAGGVKRRSQRLREVHRRSSGWPAGGVGFLLTRPTLLQGWRVRRSDSSI